MNGSPVDQLLAAIDTLDVEAALALSAPRVKLLAVDGRRAEGTDAVRKLLAEFLGSLRATTHTITAQWHQDGVWIAEVDATYELSDWSRIEHVPQAFVLRTGPEGIEDMRVYGAPEPPLTDLSSSQRRPGLWVGDRWIPPL